MTELVVDTTVLVHAGTRGGAEQRKVLELIRNMGLIFLALDIGGILDTEYNKKISKNTFAKLWLKQVSLTKKIRRHKRGPLDGKWINELAKYKLHKEDQQFVRVAMTTATKRVVAEDSHYFGERVCRILRDEFGITTERCAVTLCLHSPKAKLQPRKG